MKGSRFSCCRISVASSWQNMHRSLMIWLPALPLLIYFAVFASILGRWMLQPINLKAGRLQAPTQYLLTDFVWLVLQLQLALGFCVTWIGVEQRRFFPLVLSFLVFAVTLLWLYGVGFLSRAGVTQPARRAMFTLLLLPASLGVMMTLPALLVILAVLQIDFTHSIGTTANWAELSIPLREYQRYNVLFWIITPTLPIIGWLLRQISFWIVRDLPSEEPRRVVA
jgi:hypothetical protein